MKLWRQVEPRAPGMTQDGIAAGLLKWWMERRLGHQNPSRQLRVIETLQLNSKQSLILVDYAGQSFLVGAGSEQIGSIVRIDARNETISREAACE